MIWRNGIPEDLGTLGGDDATAIAINAASQVVGSSTSTPVHDLGDPGDHAVLWQNGAAIDLGTLGGDTSTALDISASGMVVGASTTRRGVDLSVDAEEDVRAFLWRTGRMTSLGTLGGDFSFATAIIDAGQVVGVSSTEDGTKHAFFWQGGEMTDLGALGEQMSVPMDINARQQIVGFAETNTGNLQPLQWIGGTMHALDAASYNQAAAYAVNATGDVVGEAEGTQALIWHNSRLETLLPPGHGWDTLVIARNINDAGQIVGWGYRDEDVAAFLLTPRDLEA